MFSFIWHNFFFDPVYNGLVFFIDIIPGGDVGLAIICTVLVVKIILLPLSLKAVKTQYVLREIDPQLKELKVKYKDKREEQARAMMAIYKEAGINPLSSVVLMFIQIPIIISLYLSVSTGGGVKLPDINTDLLYAVVGVPTAVSMLFLGLVDIAARSLPLALLAGGTQFLHTRMAMPAMEPRDTSKEQSLKDEFARSMQIQMRYVLPILIFFVAYTFSGAIGLYFAVSNLTAIAQEYIVRAQGIRKKPLVEVVAKEAETV